MSSLNYIHIQLFFTLSTIFQNYIALTTDTNSKIKSLCPNSFLWYTLLFASFLEISFFINHPCFYQNLFLCGFMFLTCVALTFVICFELSLSCDDAISKSLTYVSSVLNVFILFSYIIETGICFCNKLYQQNQQNQHNSINLNGKVYGATSTNENVDVGPTNLTNNIIV